MYSKQTEDFLYGLQLIIPALSLGGVETTICRFSVSSHASLSEEERLEQGITDALLRLSVVIEDADDLIRNINSAIASINRNKIYECR